MASITEFVNIIRNNVYGKNIRNAIADALEYLSGRPNGIVYGTTDTTRDNNIKVITVDKDAYTPKVGDLMLVRFINGNVGNLGLYFKVGSNTSNAYFGVTKTGAVSYIPELATNQVFLFVYTASSVWIAANTTVANEGFHGNVKLSDTISQTSSVASSTAATPKAVYDALQAAKRYADSLLASPAAASVDENAGLAVASLEDPVATMPAVTAATADDGGVLTINPKTRAVTVPADCKIIGCKGDHNSEILTFNCPAIIDGHNLADCTDVYIAWVNGGISRRYDVTDMHLEGENVVFTWTIKEDSTIEAGNIIFAIHFIEKDENGLILYRWSTTDNSELQILRSSDTEEQDGYGDGNTVIVPENIDINTLIARVESTVEEVLANG